MRDERHDHSEPLVPAERVRGLHFLEKYMKAEKTTQGVAVEFTNSEIEQLRTKIMSYDSERASRDLAIELINLFYSVNKK